MSNNILCISHLKPINVDKCWGHNGLKMVRIVSVATIKLIAQYVWVMGTEVTTIIELLWKIVMWKHDFLLISFVGLSIPKVLCDCSLCFDWYFQQANYYTDRTHTLWSVIKLSQAKSAYAIQKLKGRGRNSKPRNFSALIFL